MSLWQQTSLGPPGATCQTAAACVEPTAALRLLASEVPDHRPHRLAA